MKNLRKPLAEGPAIALARPIVSDQRATSIHGSILMGLLVFSGLMISCTSAVPPQVRILSPLDPATMPSVLLSANDEQDRVAEALSNAGVAVAADMRQATLILTARLGTPRGTKHKCGGIRNVVYELSQRGGLVAVIKARGLTGTCTPNILDAMSEELAALVQGREDPFRRDPSTGGRRPGRVGE